MLSLFVVAVLSTFTPLFAADSPGACTTDDEQFNSEEGGCLHFATGLVWSSQPVGSLSFLSAADYCATLDEGGHKDWKLPRRQDLQTIASDRRKLAYLNARRIGFFWSSGNSAAQNQWAVSFVDAEVSSLSTTEGKASVICLRQPADVDRDGVPDSSDVCNWTPSREERAADNKEVHTTGRHKGCLGGDKVISAAEVRRIGCAQENANFQSAEGGCKHLSTGLVWSAKSVALGYDHAYEYCADLKEGLREDWRMPSSEELRRVTGALRSTRAFKFALEDFFWSTGQTQSRTIDGGYINYHFFHVAIHLSSGESRGDHFRSERNYVTLPVEAVWAPRTQGTHPVVCVRP